MGIPTNVCILQCFATGKAQYSWPHSTQALVDVIIFTFYRTS